MSKLIPPDPKQCQAEKPNGYTPFTLGGIPGYVRCTNEPTWIATEAKQNEDGLVGSMSLCDDCKQVMIKQLGEDFCIFSKLGEQ